VQAEEKKRVVLARARQRPSPAAERQGAVLARAKEGLGYRARPEAVRLVVAGPLLPLRLGE
jgi:hypothetical protein